MAKTASVYDDVVVKLPVVVMAGEDADAELDDDNPFEAGLSLLVDIYKKIFPTSYFPSLRLLNQKKIMKNKITVEMTETTI